MKEGMAYNLALIAIVAILIGTVIYLHYQKPAAPSAPAAPRPPSGNYQPSTPRPPQVIITASPADYERFEQIMPQTDLVQDIPEERVIQMSFFNFNSGYREWERDYILEKGKVTQGTSDDVEIKLILHSRNLPQLNANNVCEIFQQAKTQGDFGSELLISKIKFSWRYKSMMGYKSCLGF